MNHQAGQEINVQRVALFIRWAVVGVVILAVVGLAGLWVRNQQQESAKAAFTLLFEAEKMEEVAMREGASEQRDIFDVISKWSPEKKEEYRQKLRRVLEEYPDSAAGAVAGMRLARFAFFQEKYDEAAAVFRKVAEQSPSDGAESIYKAMAYEGLGVSLEAENAHDEALKAYEAALDLRANPLKPLAYLGAARAAEQLGKVEESKGFYEKLISEFPNTEYEKRARALMAFVSNPSS